jgi:Cellulose biosynthesis GIL
MNAPEITKQSPTAIAKLTPAAAPVDAVIFAFELGIFGMPEFSSNMISGGLYALKVGTSSARFPLLSSSLQSALRSGLPCTIVTASAPDELLQRLELYGDFSAKDVLADGRLVVYSMQDEFSKKMFRYGADRLVQEFADFKIPERSYLLFDQADDLLSLHDFNLASQQIRILARWFKQRQITGLLSFSRSSDQKLDTLNTLMDHLTGIARLGGDRDGLELTFQYWRASPGVIAARNFNLYLKDTGVYAISRREAERVAPQVVADPNELAIDQEAHLTEETVNLNPKVELNVVPENESELESELEIGPDSVTESDLEPGPAKVVVEPARAAGFVYSKANNPSRDAALAAIAEKHNSERVGLKVIAKAKRSSLTS